MPFEKLTEKMAEQLYADERIRSNLTDDQASQVLRWAAEWIKGQIEAGSNEPDAQQIAKRALTHVRPLVLALNSYAERGGDWSVADALAALAPALQSDRALAQAQVVELLASIPRTEQRT